MSAVLSRTEPVALVESGSRRSAFVACAWIAAAVIGEQAMIALYEPGAWQFGFQPVGNLRYHVVALAFAAGLVAACAVGIARLWTLRWDRKHGWRALSVGAVWIIATTLLARHATDYAAHLVLTAAMHVAGLGCMLFAARSLPERFALSGALAGEQPGVWRVVLASALFTTVASAAFAWMVFHRVPHITDEAAYMFQAQTYAHGRAYLPAPPTPELFRQFLTMVHDGKWFSVFPPGWPLLLAVGVLAGVPWLVNPVLAGIAIVLIYCLVVRVHDSFTAMIAAVLIATSPLYVVLSATYMAHLLSIVCALIALISILELQKGARIWWAVAGGAGLGVLFLARPIEAVSVGVIAIAMCLGAFGGRVRAAAVATAVAVMAAFTSLFFVNNWLLTGNALRDPIQLFFDVTYYPGADALGFGPTKGNVGWGSVLPGHSPLEAAINLNQNLSIVDTELFGWLGGALLFVVMLAVWRRPRGMWLWVAMIVAILIPTTLYWYSGADLGPRYWYQTLIPFAVLTALGMRALADGIGAGQRRVASVALVLAVIGFFQITVWRATEKYQRYRGVSSDVGRLIHDKGMEQGLIFVRNGNPANDYGDYAGGFVWMGIPLGSGPIFARDSSASLMAELHARFPNRRRWIIAPVDAAGRYEIVATLDSAANGGRMDNGR